MTELPITVIGGTSLIGRFLLTKMLAKNQLIQALTRQVITSNAKQPITWHRLNQDLDISGLKKSDILIHLAPIWTLCDYLPQLTNLGIKRVIAFSSTSQFTKKASSDDNEQLIVKKLADAERQIINFCNAHTIAWTIFRPTLIYGDVNNNDPSSVGKGLAVIIKFIKIFRLFPLVAKGAGLRQPVHAEDLAEACIAALNNQHTYNKAYNLSGAEVITYQQMIIQIFIKLGVRPRFLILPLSLIRGILWLIRIIPKYRFLTLAMANRMNQDMVFDYLDANQDFGYRPRKFLV